MTENWQNAKLPASGQGANLRPSPRRRARAGVARLATSVSSGAVTHHDEHSADSGAEGSRITSGRRVRLPDRYPIVTLAEAMTWLAFGRFHRAAVLSRWWRGHGQRPPLATVERLHATGPRVARLIGTGSLLARGYRQESEDGDVAPNVTEIPAAFVAGGVYCEARLDAIVSDILLDEAHFGRGVYPMSRHVTIDARRLPGAPPIETNAALPGNRDQSKARVNVKRSAHDHFVRLRDRGALEAGTSKEAVYKLVAEEMEQALGVRVDYRTVGAAISKAVDAWRPQRRTARRKSKAKPTR